MERISMREFLNPFEHKVTDRIIQIIFLICILNISIAVYDIITTKPPIPIAAKILVYLLEVNPNVCYGQNTKEHRLVRLYSI